MGNILDKIIVNKHREVEAKAAMGVYSRLETATAQASTTRSMSRALKESATGIIAEFKRYSPSKGAIHPQADVTEIVPGYEAAGATACSILTDTRFFGGSETDLANARSTVSLPLLRKDFIIDSRQIMEAAVYGADAVLLIAAALSFDEIVTLTDCAHSYGLEVLLELHNERELDRFYPEVDMVGVNNRDLTTFVTDPMLSLRLATQLPEEIVKIAESGLTSFAEVRKLREAGYRGFLIGERFMREADPAGALKMFINGK